MDGIGDLFRRCRRTLHARSDNAKRLGAQSLISIAQREQVAVQILAKVWKRFSDGLQPEDAGDIAADIDLPRPVTMEILGALIECGLLARAAGQGGVLPARDLNRPGVGDLLLAYRHAGRTSHGEAGGQLFERIVRLHGQFEERLRAEGSLDMESILEPGG